jgi:cellulose synthase/poly-beta-1,6-N-acetylglucosamine synthase-like glycosyltransferase
MIALTIIISITYFSLIFFLIIGFYRIKEFKSEESKEDSSFSIVIPFRNEAKNLPDLLKSISQINYPKTKFEIILVNDDSDDRSVEIIEKFKTGHAGRQVKNSKPATPCLSADKPTGGLKISIIDNQKKSGSPKKDAIDLAIKKSKFDWIITTDADCIVPVNWLIVLNGFIHSQEPKMIVMPVSYEIHDGLFNGFQNLELLSLQGATIGGFGLKKPFLCNGANLCYKKNCFMELDGFSGNDNIASGDDVFMLEKMVRRYPAKVKYLKSKGVIVKTNTEKQFSDMVNQRIRWATKTTSYKNNFGKLVGLSVLSMNILILTLLLLTVFNLISWPFLAVVFFIKILVDFLLIVPAALFFEQQYSLRNFLIVSFLYPFYNTFIGILSLTKTYEWKGRKFSK